jgi:hypothetical protein
MDEEFALLLKNGTWKLEKLPDGFKSLPIKWGYKIKRDANGNIGYKARLLAKGYLVKNHPYMPHTNKVAIYWRSKQARSPFKALSQRFS